MGPRGAFKPSEEPLPKVHLPKAWSHPSRRIMRIRPPMKRQGIDRIYVVERILDERTNGEEMEYLVKWEGYSLKESTWEPAENLGEGANEILTEWKEKIAEGRKDKTPASGRPTKRRRV
jgi:Chromo (CHRromatin Organisation MOdifier) domain